MDIKELEAMDPTRKKRDIFRVSARVQEALSKELNKRAKQANISLNSLLTHIIIEFLKKN